MNLCHRRGWLAISACLLSYFLMTSVSLAQDRPVDRFAMERMAAWQETMVFGNETRPHTAVLTYVEERDTHTDQHLLLKMIPFVGPDNESFLPIKPDSLKVEDFPGGIEGQFATETGVAINYEMMPLIVGQDTTEQDGVALYTIKTDPPTPLLIQCGASGHFTFHRPEKTIRDEGFVGGSTQITINGQSAEILSEEQPLAVALTSDGSLSQTTTPEGDGLLELAFPEGQGTIYIAFAPEPEAASALLEIQKNITRASVDAHYEALLSSRIETPEPLLDEGFRTGIYNLEYNWLKPLGWTECIHHWVSMFHMQHTAAAEWLGQAERSRMTTESQAERLSSQGWAPHLFASGGTYRAFGGTNQFFAWQIWHYWRMTADKDFIAAMAEPLDRVIEQTYDERDPEGDYMLSWKSQIGNQEDYLHQPHNSASATIEGINMMRTRAEIAEALGDSETAERMHSRIAIAKKNLRKHLWDRSLGRMIYFQDPSGKDHLDGQYQTFIYPLIWDIVDPLDAWTSMRHLRDRLTGVSGEIYCSNNFSNHVGGTWGMQAGASQQPWSTMGLARMGLRNEAPRSLIELARWVTNKNLRGSWPEVSLEPTPAYFSPPAGVYIQAVIEDLFGLQLNRPKGELTIAPSFPDDWPEAKLYLPEYEAQYTREGNTLEYRVTSKETFDYKIDWLLPPASIRSFTVNGKQAEYTITPAVNCIRLTANVPATQETLIRIELDPLAYNIEAPLSLAEGESFEALAKGVELLSLEDRSGLLTNASIAKDSLQATLAEGLLDAYQGYGKLGQLNFSRRTFFLKCQNDEIVFWYPVDLTILPPQTAAQERSLHVTDAGNAAVSLKVRNNSAEPVSGVACLLTARGDFACELNLAPRSEQVVDVTIPHDHCVLLSPGDNAARLVLPNGESLDLTVSVEEDFFESTATVRDYATSRLEMLELPGEMLVSGEDWHSFRPFRAYHHPPWSYNRPPLEGLEDTSELSSPELPLVKFKLQPEGLLPISATLGRPAVQIDLDGASYKKLYLLVVPWLDNHDVFSPVAQVIVKRLDGRQIGKTLYFPGDLDSWCPESKLGPFATRRSLGRDRLGLLPQLPSGQADWDEGKPFGDSMWGWPSSTEDYGFPQTKFWARMRNLIVPSATMNIIEIDLGESTTLDSVMLSTVGTEPALGLVAISAEGTGGTEHLLDSEWMPPAKFAEPIQVFQLRDAEDLEGWTFEGEAFSLTDIPGLSPLPTLNSLGKAGEQATGQVVSPIFTIDERYRSLSYNLQGGTSDAPEGPGQLTIDLVDAKTGEVLNRFEVKGNHNLRREYIAIDPAWTGRELKLVLTDRKSDTGYAWLGLSDVELAF